MKQLFLKIDPQYKVNKVQVSYNGPENGLIELKRYFNTIKSSQIYPSFDKEYKYTLFFYDISESFLSLLKSTAPQILTKYFTKPKKKKKSPFVAGIPILLLFILIAWAYNVYNTAIIDALSPEKIQQTAINFLKLDTYIENEKDKLQNTLTKQIEKVDDLVQNKEQISIPQTTVAVSREQRNLEVHFIDVGQGDCILIKTALGRFYMIDAGSRKSYNKIENYLKNQKVRTIDALVLTHPHEDHIGGAIQIINNFKVNHIIEPGVPYTTVSYRNLLELINKKRIKYSIAKAGTQLRWYGLDSVRLLHPGNVTPTQNVNNASVVLRIQYGNISFLFTGDAEQEAEDEILQRYRNIHSTVLKVGHHGSHTSSSQSFIRAVKPAYAVIQVGSRNKYGHPHQATLNLFRKNNIKIFQTDNEGTIVFITDGKTIEKL